MPSHGVDIINGIPVILRDSIMYSFQPGSTSTQLQLGTYDSKNKKATWMPTDTPQINEWVKTYRESLTSRSRK